MGAIFFYIFIYFVGYYASNILNMLTVHPLVTNRYMAALVPVYAVALTHAYVMVSSPPPQGTDITVEYALLVFITLPVIVVTMGAAYFMWNSKAKPDDSSQTQIEKESNDVSDTEIIEKKEAIQSENVANDSEKTENQETDVIKRKDV